MLANKDSRLTTLVENFKEKPDIKLLLQRVNEILTNNEESNEPFIKFNDIQDKTLILESGLDSINLSALDVSNDNERNQILSDLNAITLNRPQESCYDKKRDFILDKPVLSHRDAPMKTETSLKELLAESKNFLIQQSKISNTKYA